MTYLKKHFAIVLTILLALGGVGWFYYLSTGCTEDHLASRLIRVIFNEGVNTRQAEEIVQAQGNKVLNHWSNNTNPLVFDIRVPYSQEEAYAKKYTINPSVHYAYTVGCNLGF